MSDEALKIILSGGLALFMAAAAAALWSPWGHWPLSAAMLVMVVAMLSLLIKDGFPADTFHITMVIIAMLALAGVGWHLWSPSLASLSAYVLMAVILGLLLLAAVLFAWLFRMDRLW